MDIIKKYLYAEISDKFYINVTFYDNKFVYFYYCVVSIMWIPIV